MRCLQASERSLLEVQSWVQDHTRRRGRPGSSLLLLPLLTPSRAHCLAWACREIGDGELEAEPRVGGYGQGAVGRQERAEPSLARNWMRPLRRWREASGLCCGQVNPRRIPGPVPASQRQELGAGASMGSQKEGHRESGTVVALGRGASSLWGHELHLRVTPPLPT